MSNLALTAAAFKDGDALPVKNTCDGENKSPALSWSGVPEGTQSLALIADDPDAPMGTFTHWVLYNMPPAQTSLPEGVPQVAQPRGYGTQGMNSCRHTGYDGPCPPKGPEHRYFFRLYALDLPPNLQGGLTAAQLAKAMEGHIVGQAQVMGHYHR